MHNAARGFGQRGGHIGRPDGLAGGRAFAGAAGQRAVVAGGVEGIGHVLPVGGRRPGVGVDALILGGAADGPVKAAGAVIVKFRVAEIVLHLGVLLQPAGQRFQLRRSRVDLCARIGRHREQGFLALGIDAHHRAHRRGERALGKIRQREHAVVLLVEPAKRQHGGGQQRVRQRLRGAGAPAARARLHGEQDDGRRGGKRQQEHPGVLAVEVGAGKPCAGRQQPRPQPPRRGQHGAQRRACHTGKKDQAQRGEDIVAVDAQRVGRPAGRQKGQRRKQRQRVRARRAGGLLPPQRRKRKRRQRRRRAPQRRAGNQVRQVQRVQQRQPYGEEHRLGQRQVVIRAQPLPCRDGVGGAEHQFIVQRRAAHPDIRLLEPRERAAQTHQQCKAQPEGAGAQLQAGFSHFCSFSILSTRYFCCLNAKSSSSVRYLTTMASTANSPAKPTVMTNIVVVQPATGRPVKNTISV